MSCPFGYGRKPDAGDAETANDAPMVEAIVTDGGVGLKRCECGDDETKRGRKMDARWGSDKRKGGARGRGNETRGYERERMYGRLIVKNTNVSFSRA